MTNISLADFFGELNKSRRLLPEENNRPLLIYGIGNQGRQDDGLGIRFIEELEAIKDKSASNWFFDVTLESNYQLNVEDALMVSEHSFILFIDATYESLEGKAFALRRLKPSSDIAFSTHGLGFETILAITEQFYQKTPQAFLLTLPGQNWEIQDQLSPFAESHLATALTCFKKELDIYLGAKGDN